MNGIQTGTVDQRIARIKSLSNTNGTARKIFEILADRKNSNNITSVDRLTTQVKGSSRAEIEDVLRKFEDIGLGKFIIGRPGTTGREAKTRFRWYMSLTSVAKVALTDEDRLFPLTMPAEFQEDDDSVEAQQAEYATLPLRPGFSLRVPADITRDEIERSMTFFNLLGLRKAS